MTTLEFCLDRRKAEIPTFVRVLKALPEACLEYRPHERCRTAAEIAWTIACEEADLLVLLEKGSVDFKETKPPKTAGEIVSAYERNSAAVNAALETLHDSAWQKKGAFMMDGKPVWETTIGAFAWGFLFDAIHHRGQLTAYIRPMGGKVPSIYGPSGDDPGQS